MLLDHTNVSLGSFTNMTYYNTCMLLDHTNVLLGSFTNTSYCNMCTLVDSMSVKLYNVSTLIDSFTGKKKLYKFKCCLYCYYQ